MVEGRTTFDEVISRGDHGEREREREILVASLESDAPPRACGDPRTAKLGAGGRTCLESVDKLGR